MTFHCARARTSRSFLEQYENLLQGNRFVNIATPKQLLDVKTNESVPAIRFTFATTQSTSQNTCIRIHRSQNHHTPSLHTNHGIQRIKREPRGRVRADKRPADLAKPTGPFRRPGDYTTCPTPTSRAQFRHNTTQRQR